MDSVFVDLCYYLECCDRGFVSWFRGRNWDTNFYSGPRTDRHRQYMGELWRNTLDTFTKLDDFKRKGADNPQELIDFVAIHHQKAVEHQYGDRVANCPYADNRATVIVKLKNDPQSFFGISKMKYKYKSYPTIISHTILYFRIFLESDGVTLFHAMPVVNGESLFFDLFRDYLDDVCTNFGLDDWMGQDLEAVLSHDKEKERIDKFLRKHHFLLNHNYKVEEDVCGEIIPDELPAYDFSFIAGTNPNKPDWIEQKYRQSEADGDGRAFIDRLNERDRNMNWDYVRGGCGHDGVPSASPPLKHTLHDANGNLLLTNYGFGSELVRMVDNEGNIFGNMRFDGMRRLVTLKGEPWLIVRDFLAKNLPYLNDKVDWSVNEAWHTAYSQGKADGMTPPKLPTAPLLMAMTNALLPDTYH